MNERHTKGGTVRPNERRSRRYAPRVPTAITAVGLFLGATIALEWALFEPSLKYRLVEVVFSGVPALTVAYAGRWLDRSELSRDRYSRVGGWVLVLMVSFFGVNLALMSFFSMDSLALNVAWGRWAAIFGALGGLVIGVVEARAVERARVAERAAVRAEHVESQRNLLIYLNGVLRHEVLNTANVVEGYADLLIEKHDGVTRDRLERIRHQSQNMAEVIRDVRVLIEATEGGSEFHVLDLGDVLAGAAADLRTAHDRVEVDLSAPDDAFVAADDLLSRVFSNLLTNAVQHNDSDVPRVSVTVETSPDAVTVRVADNGHGVPDAERSTLFQRTARGTSHGLGLYLVRTLARRYGGSAELRETGPGGSVFAVELPRTADPSADGEGEEERPAATGPGDDAFAPPMESESV